MTVLQWGRKFCNIYSMKELLLHSEMIRRMLDAHGHSVSAFSHKLGVDRSTLHRWLDERRLPSSDRALDLAAAIDVDPLALWDLAPETFSQLLPHLTRVAR